MLVFFVAFTGYVAVVTRNTKGMTIRQKVLKAVYPAFTWWGRISGKNSKVFTNESPAVPPQSLYDLSVTLNNGESIPLSNYRGKKLLLVNTASDCGYTDQYDDLQKLYDENKDNLVIIGFPANDFKEQEKGTDEEIARFCKLNYGVTFPMAEKVSVKGDDIHPLFRYLTDEAEKMGVKDPIKWNFTKFLVDEKGKLVAVYPSKVKPMSEEITKYLN